MQAFKDINGQVIAGPFTPVASSGGTLATSTTVAQALGPFGPANAPSVVRLHSSTDCFVQVAAAPIAANTDCLLSSSFPEFIVVPAGQKISVLAQTTAGNINWCVVK